jgi:hypothetical protein
MHVARVRSRSWGRRTLASVAMFGVCLLVTATAVGASTFAAVIEAKGLFSSGTMLLEGTAGSASCYSTGTGSGGTVSTNASACPSGSPLPTGTLSAASSSSASSTLSSVGTVSASGAIVGSSSCGVAELQDTAGTSAWGGSGEDTALVFNGLTYKSAGPLGSQAIATDGSTGWAETTVEYTEPQTFTVLAWFKTGSDSGSIFGFTNAESSPTTAGNYDRQLWIDPSGHLVWGLYNNATYEATSGSSYANGSWHFLAASVGSAGQELYVDGALVGTNANTLAQDFSGWWNVGISGAANGGWPDAPTSAYFDGSIAQVAVIPTQLSTAQVSALYGDTTLSAYTAAVNALSPVNYWPLNDSGGLSYEGSVPGAAASTTLADASGNGNTGTAEGGTTLGVSGPLGGSAVSLNGTSGYVETTNSYTNPEGTSEVAWFESSTAGGTILGFTSAQGNTGQGEWDRQVWLDGSGKLVFGVYPGATDEVASSGTYDNGQWHMVVAEIGAAGQTLWVDGVKVASNAAVTTAQNYTGYWHLGWASQVSWPDPPTSSYLSGSLSEVAIVPSQLSSSQIAALYSAGSTAVFAADLAALAPTSYWPLQDSASNICGTTEVTVQQTAGTTSTCIYPAGSGACPAPSATYLVIGLGVRSATAPTSANAVTVKITMELSASAGAGVLGLHMLPAIVFGTTRSSTLWSAQIAYPYATVQL